MKEIVKPVRVIAELLGKPREPASAVRMTSHCVRAACEGGELLYHTLTGEMILAEEGELASHSLDRSLLARHFLVADGYDESGDADRIRKTVRLMSRDGRIDGFTVLTTTDCNARCFYCYEKGIPRFSMSKETAERAAEYMLSVSGEKKIGIGWFGGEPLFNKEAMSVISRRLHEAGKEFTSHMASNGYLFDKETVSEARDLWRLKRVQITLDGTEKAYNRIKAYAVPEGGSPFRRVIENIGLLLDEGIAVAVRLNMNRHNFPDLQKLACQLGELFSGRKGFCAFPMPIRGFSGDAGEFGTPGEELDAYRKLKRLLAECGIGREEVLNTRYSPTRCIADNDCCDVIYPDGSLARCEHYDGKEVCGDVLSGRCDLEAAGSWKEETVFEGCSGCPLYPRCVNLKKCPWSAFGCSESVKAIRIENLKDRMTRTYERFCQETEKEKTETTHD
ncbi:MAG: radical SAM protein [Clostridiales bacterium]|nr:radical SAM protein [Clostridiales bacterium]